MALQLYSTRFIWGHVNAATPFLTYVVPAGRVVVVRTVTMAQGGVGTMACYAQLQPTGSALAAPFFVFNTPALLINSAEWSGRLVANAGDTLIMQRIAPSGDFWVTMSGYLLTV